MKNTNSIAKIALAITLFCGLQSKAQENQQVAIPEIKVALTGDTEAATNFESVLKLVTAEKANLLMINGDFGYGYSPATWQKKVTSTVDINTLPIIATLGNHDVGGTKTDTYINIIQGFRNAKNGLTTACTGKPGVSEGHDITAVDEVCTIGNISIVGSGIGQVLSKTYLENRLDAKLKAVPNGNWKLAGYHFTLASMNPGIKGDEATQKFFDIIRQNGAIGAQGHTHIAMASCPISSTFQKGAAVQCHPSFTNPAERFIMPGTGIYVDSSLGGKEARPRLRCKTANEKGCQHMVDMISQEGYSRTDGITKKNFTRFGALFIIFNAGGNPNKAYAYFKSVDGQTIFSFNITR